MNRKTCADASFGDLLDRARASDQAALEELFIRYQPRIGEWATQRLRKPLPGFTRPSDIAQETVLHAFRKFSTFSGETESEWIAWLKSIFRNCTRQSIRDARRKKRQDSGTLPLDSDEAIEAPSTQKSPSQATAHEEEWRQTLIHIYQLPEDQRDAIWLCHLKDFPVAEVAQRMNKTAGAVAGLLQRGMNTLRDRASNAETAAHAEAPDSQEALNETGAALLIYLQRRDAGQTVDKDAFVAEHSACTNELYSMLQWVERIQAIRPSSIDA